MNNVPEKNRKGLKWAAGCGLAALFVILGMVLYETLFLPVPWVVGQTKESAVGSVEAAGFACVVEESYSASYEYGTILYQDREGRCFRYSPVYLIVSLGPNRDLSEVPEVLGEQLSSGASKLAEAGFKNLVIIPVTDTDCERGEITDQSIPGGVTVSRENVISLSVASDGEELVVLIGDRVLTLSGTEPVTVAYDELPIAQTDFDWQDPYYRISADSALGQLGLPDTDAREVTSLYAYGNTLRETHDRAVLTSVSGQELICLPDTDEKYSPSPFSALSELPGLPNLEELTLAGCSLSSLSGLAELGKLKVLDISGNPGLSGQGAEELSELSALGQLEELNIAWTGISGVSALASFPSLRTVYADSSMRESFDDLGETEFEVVYLDTLVTDAEELSEALSDESVLRVYIGADILIPGDCELTVRPSVTVSGGSVRLLNAGSLSVSGTWAVDSADFENIGTVKVTAGGFYAGSGGSIYQYGSFQVESGGLHLIGSGQSLKQYQGEYRNEGTVVLRADGSISVSGGSLVNSGRLLRESGGAAETEVLITEGNPPEELTRQETEEFLAGYGGE